MLKKNLLSIAVVTAALSLAACNDKEAVTEPVEPEAIADMSDAELKEFTSWDYHSLSSNEIKEPRVKAYVEAYEAYREAESARQEEWLKQRYIQWPVAWADAMLKARQQPQE